MRAASCRTACRSFNCDVRWANISSELVPRAVSDHFSNSPASDRSTEDPLPQLPEVKRMSTFGGSLQSVSPTTNGDIWNGAHLFSAKNESRRISSGYPPSLHNGDSPRSQLPVPMSSPRASTPEPAQWSSAVGHATTTGKSGRVIEKLMADNDRLKRELKEHQIKAEELQRNMLMFKPQIETLQAENDNLSHARGVDQSLLTRRDRQIKDLKSELGVQKQKTHSLEQRVIQLQMERDEAVDTKERDIQTFQDQALHAENHAHVLETGFRQIRAEYETRTERTQNDLEVVKAERRKDAENLERLDVVSNQMRQENERIRKQFEQMMSVSKQLQEASKQHVRDMEKETKGEQEKARKLNIEMDQVVKEMRWVISLKRNTELDGEHI